MSPLLFFIIFFTYTGMGKIFLQINSAAVAFIDILIAACEGLSKDACTPKVMTISMGEMFQNFISFKGKVLKIQQQKSEIWSNRKGELESLPK